MRELLRSLRSATAIGVLSALALLGAQTGDVAEQDEAFAVRYLLGIQSPKFWVSKGQNDRFYDSLAEYKGWSEAYIRARDAAGRDDDRALRRLLFMGFVAQTRNDAALSETLSTDLYPLVAPRRDAVFKLLNELPFLARSTCFFLRAHHGFEGRNRETREKAMADLAQAAGSALSPAAARPCVEELRR
jgi:hypothetical protein